MSDQPIQGDASRISLGKAMLPPDKYADVVAERARAKRPSNVLGKSMRTDAAAAAPADATEQKMLAIAEIPGRLRDAPSLFPGLVHAELTRVPKPRKGALVELLDWGKAHGADVTLLRHLADKLGMSLESDETKGEDE